MHTPRARLICFACMKVGVCVCVCCLKPAHLLPSFDYTAMHGTPKAGGGGEAKVSLIWVGLQLWADSPPRLLNHRHDGTLCIACCSFMGWLRSITQIVNTHTLFQLICWLQYNIILCFASHLSSGKGK
jgi:hypothetical protein